MGANQTTQAGGRQPNLNGNAHCMSMIHGCRSDPCPSPCFSSEFWAGAAALTLLSINRIVGHLKAFICSVTTVDKANLVREVCHEHQCSALESYLAEGESDLGRDPGWMPIGAWQEARHAS